MTNNWIFNISKKANYDKIQIGKVYKFDQRKARVTSKDGFRDVKMRNAAGNLIPLGVYQVHADLIDA